MGTKQHVQQGKKRELKLEVHLRDKPTLRTGPLTREHVASRLRLIVAPSRNYISDGANPMNFGSLGRRVVKSLVLI